MNKAAFLIVIFCCFSFLAGCAAQAPESRPLQALSFQNLPPKTIDVADIRIENRYNPAASLRDVSSSFPTPPDMALRRYAENRLRPSGRYSAGELYFIIEEVNSVRDVRQPEGMLNQWFGTNKQDYYEVAVRLRLYAVSPEGIEGRHSVLNIKRWIAIPQRYSLSEKEQEKQGFIQTLIEDVDQAVQKALREKHGLI